MHRTLTFILSLAIGLFGSLANAQEVKFWLAYGDQEFASLNSNSEGEELAACSNVGALAELEVWIMATNLTASPRVYGFGGVFLGFDSAVKDARNYANYSEFVPAQTQNCLSPVLPNPLIWEKGLPGRSNDGTDAVVDVVQLGNLAYSGSAGAGTSDRPIGFWQALGFGTGLNLFLGPQATVRLCAARFKPDPIQLATKGPCWGDDASESGLVLHGINIAASRFCYLGSTSGTGGLRVPVKYGLSVNPGTFALDDTYLATEDTPLLVGSPGVKANDPNGNAYTAILYTAPAHGTVTLGPQGDFQYTPNLNFHGIDEFRYYLTDGTKSSNVATVTLNVASVLDPLLISGPGPITSPELQPISFKVIGSNVDFPGQAVVYQLERAPEGASIGVLNGQFVWTPTEAQGPKPHTFDVVCTGVWSPEQIARKSVTILVTEVNRPPSIGPLPRLSVAMETPLIRKIPASDPDLPSQSLTYGFVGTVPQGLLIGPEGDLYWFPRTGQGPSSYEVTIQVRDSGGLTASTKQWINVIEKPWVSGHVIFGDFVGPKPQTLTMSIKDTASDAGVTLQDVELDQTGQFSFKLPGAGVFDVRTKIGTWLGRTLRINAENGDVTGEVWNLINGDCDGDNYIGTDDYLMLTKAFGIEKGQPGFDPRADLNGDGSVDTDDYLILSQSFDTLGDA